jgi:catechol 2,3-dioxygenase-like lactoylglutathione lyase family enzyme
MSAAVSGLHHFTVGCAPGDLPVLLQFYTTKIGLREGYRPTLRHAGHWLYAGDHAIVHLNALLPCTPTPTGGPLDHVALAAHGLDNTREFLHAESVTFTERPLNGTTLHQVFLKDPLGLTIELTFDLSAEMVPQAAVTGTD